VKRWADDLSVSPEIVSVNGEIATDLIAGGTPIVSVFDQDAKQARIAREELARVWARSLEQAVRSYREDHSARNIAWRVVLTCLILAGVALCLFLVGRTFPRSGNRVAARLTHALEHRDRRIIDLISNEGLERLVSRFFVWLRRLAYAAVLFAGLQLLLILFPRTRADVLRLWSGPVGALTQLGVRIWEQIPAVILIAIIAFITFLILRLVHLLFRKVAEEKISFEGFRPTWAGTTDHLISIFIVVLALLIAYPYIPGSDSAAFKEISIFLGALVSLGSTGLIGNLIAGIMLTYMDAFQVGDYVRIGETTGYIARKSMMTTRTGLTIG